MITVEELTPEWEGRFLESRNAIFTPVSAEYLAQLSREPAFPVRTFLCRDEGQVLSWASFYLREVEVGRSRPLRLGQACAIGTLPEHQRKGLARKAWQCAEKALARDCDGIAIYTNECSDGYAFYRAMGYQPLAFPEQMRLDAKRWLPSRTPARTIDFSEANFASESFGDVFRRCYEGHAGYLSGRPHILSTWARSSFFYDPAIIGHPPRLSWIEDENGHALAYCVWVHPMTSPSWKHGAAEIWELAADKSITITQLRDLLQPVVEAASSAPLDWWAIPGHPLSSQMAALGFDERPRGLSVLARLFHPAENLREHLAASSWPGRVESRPGGRVDLHWDDILVEIEKDAAPRLALGRTTPAEESQLGHLTVKPSSKHASALATLTQALPARKWAYLASEFI